MVMVFISLLFTLNYECIKENSEEVDGEISKYRAFSVNAARSLQQESPTSLARPPPPPHRRRQKMNVLLPLRAYPHPE